MVILVLQRSSLLAVLSSSMRGTEENLQPLWCMLLLLLLMMMMMTTMSLFLWKPSALSKTAHVKVQQCCRGALHLHMSLGLRSHLHLLVIAVSFVSMVTDSSDVNSQALCWGEITEAQTEVTIIISTWTMLTLGGERICEFLCSNSNLQ